MEESKLEEYTRRLIDNRGWGLWFRVVEWVFAAIILSLIAFSFSQFKSYADYTGWIWGPIGISFAAWAVASIPARVVLGRRFRSLTFDIIILTFHWIDYVFFLIIVEGMAFTIRTKNVKFRYCVAVTGERIFSAECNAVYATLAFAGVDLLLAFLSAIAVTVAIQCYYRRRYKDRNGLVQRISSPGESASRDDEEG